MALQCTKDELLKFVVENGMIDLSNIEAEINMMNKRRYLDRHEFSIWQGKNGMWYTYLPDESKPEGRVQRKRSTRNELESIIIEYYESIENEPTVKNVFQMWNNSRLEYGEIEKQSYDRYETDFERFFSKSEIYDVKIKLVTENELEEFIRKCVYEMNLSSKAFSGLRIILSGIFKYAKRNKWTDISITNFFGDLEFSRKSFKKTKKEDEEIVFNDKEVERITDYILKHKDLVNLGILLCFQTGLRRGELSSLKCTDFHSSISKIDKTEVVSGYLEINKTEVRYKDNDGHFVFEVRDSAKTDAGNRNVVVSSATANVIKMIQSINNGSEYLFFENGERIRSYTFERRITKICKILEIPHRTMHGIRKTYATKLINAGVDERIIIRQMGHTNISCTKNFYYYNNKSSEDVAIQIEGAVCY